MQVERENWPHYIKGNLCNQKENKGNGVANERFRVDAILVILGLDELSDSIHELDEDET